MAGKNSGGWQIEVGVWWWWMWPVCEALFACNLVEFGEPRPLARALSADALTRHSKRENERFGRWGGGGGGGVWGGGVI